MGRNNTIIIEIPEKEFKRLKTAKGELTWRQVLERSMPKSPEELLKEEADRFFTRIGGYALMSKNFKFSEQLNLMKGLINTTLDHEVQADKTQVLMLPSKTTKRQGISGKGSSAYTAKKRSKK